MLAFIPIVGELAIGVEAGIAAGAMAAIGAETVEASIGASTAALSAMSAESLGLGSAGVAAASTESLASSVETVILGANAGDLMLKGGIFEASPIFLGTI